MPADADRVRELRRAIVAFVEATCANAGELADDVALAVTEACGNVVRHAYPDRRGRLCVDARLDGGELVVVVADDGVGIGARSPNHGLGLGLHLIETLANARVTTAGGTRVEMRFAAARRGVTPR